MVKISFESWNTFKKLSALSGMDINAIIAEWAKGMSEVLESFGDVNRISLMSARYEKDNVTVTYLAPIMIGSFKIPECLDEDTKDLVSDRFLKLDVSEKMRKRKKAVKA